VANILDLTTLPEHFTRPVGFSLPAFWRAHVERYEQRAQQGSALVRLSPRGVAALPDVLGTRTGQVATRTVGSADADGWYRVVVPIESVEHASVALLKLGADAQVLAPPDLVERIADTVRTMAGYYLTRRS
jgi:predicted DNA-binding transcriptional regulator YafY